MLDMAFYLEGLFVTSTWVSWQKYREIQNTTAKSETWLLGHNNGKPFI
jgi:hypothetical protein